MNSITVFSFQSPSIITWGDSVFDAFIQSLDENNFTLENGDIISITSKIISMEEQAAIKLDGVTVGEKAKNIASQAKMRPEVVQIVLDECNGEIFGFVEKAILAKTRYGLSANAGIDLSNCPEGWALLLPRDPDKSAVEIRKKLMEKYNVDVAVIITDSRTIPLKRGTTAVSLGVAGMEPLIDERGKNDLYGYKMALTTRAIADNAATATNLLMGETSERTPFAVLRGLDYPRGEDVSMQSTLMPETECLYFGPLLQLIGDQNN